MKWLAFCLGLFVAAAPAYGGQIGDFSVDVQRDPFDQADRYIASTEQNDSALFVRCLNGKVGMAFGFYANAKLGDPVTIKLRIGYGDVDEMAGKVVASLTNQIIVQAGDLSIVEKLQGARTAAVKYEIGSVGAFYTFSMRGVDKIVAGVKNACRV